eukprot:5546161-Pleurochrysis_carterae.AAC.1
MNTVEGACENGHVLGSCRVACVDAPVHALVCLRTGARARAVEWSRERANASTRAKRRVHFA